MLWPSVASWVAALLLRLAWSHYSSDRCSWKGSGPTHETHTRDVGQVYLRCSQGTLEWLYPTGAIIVNLRPNTDIAPGRLFVCIRPSAHSSGSNIYLERAGELKLLLLEEKQASGQVHCFGIQEGVLFIEAVPQQDISRKVTAFQYELLREPFSLTAPCQLCSEADVLLAMCASDFVARGSIQGVEVGTEHTSVAVTVSRLYRQKSWLFTMGRGRVQQWTGRVLVPPQCGAPPGGGEFLFTGSVHFGEAWLVCAPRYSDFLRLYGKALQQNSNPCQINID